MTEYYERSAWTAVPRPLERLAPLVPDHVRGIAVHTPGSPAPPGTAPGLVGTARRLEELRALQAPRPGWEDLAYTVAVDVDGRVLDGRGLEHQPAANGSATGNEQYGAALWLLGSGEQPTAAMVEAFRDWRRTRWLARYPQATAVVGHRDLFPTDCPGPAVQALITAGALTSPARTTGGPVALSDDEIDAIATRTRDKILAVTYGNRPDGSPFTLGMLWGEVRVNALRAATGVDVDALAAAVVARLPAGGVDSRELASALADELVARLRG